MSLSERSLTNLKGVHPDLVKVILRASDGPISFLVTEGLRPIERQRILVAEGKSKTMHSRHLTGHAVDLAVVQDGELRWDWPSYRFLAYQVKAAASESNVPIEWGGDWTSFKDGPHFQLPFKEYPDP